MEIQTFLFDLDGTIIDSRSLIKKSILYSLEKLGLPTVTENQISDTIGLPIDKQIQKILPNTPQIFEKNIIMNFIKENLEYQIKNWKGLVMVCDGVFNLLDFLKEKKKKLGIVTSRGVTSTILFLKEFGLIDYFDCCIAFEQTKKHKPDPDPVLFALHYLQESPKQSIYIGDAPYDIICGHKAGVLTGKAVWCAHTNRDEVFPEPNYTFSNCAEIKNLLG